jgi:hypothetical protein
MAIGKISGQMLQSDLVRQGVDLAIDSTLVYFDVANRRVGFNTVNPSNAVSVNGNVNAQYYFGLIGTVDQPLITNVGPLGNLTVTGNLTVGNISIDGATANTISLTGDIISTAGNIRANLGQVSSNSISGNILSIAGIASITGNANIGNLTFTNTTVSTKLTDGNIYLAPTGTGMVQINGTNAFSMPSGNTAQQPSYVPAGSMRYNSDTEVPEFYNGIDWISVTTNLISQTITPSGSSNAFVLTSSTTTGGVIVSLNGVIQSPSTAYSVSGNVITFTETPLSTDIIDVRFISTGQVYGLNFGGNVPTTSSSTGAKGQVAYDSNFIYICVAQNTWIRANIQSTF